MISRPLIVFIIIFFILCYLTVAMTGYISDASMKEIIDSMTTKTKATMIICFSVASGFAAYLIERIIKS